MQDKEKSGQSRGRFPIPEMKIRNPLTDGRTDRLSCRQTEEEREKEGWKEEGALLYTEEEEAGKNGWKRRAQT